MRQVINIPDRKVSVIKHLKKQLNMSGYVVALIERDMKEGVLNKEEIIKIVKEYMGQGQQDTELLDSIQDCLSF